MGKTTDTFGRLKFSCHKTYCFKPKVMLQVEQATQELLMIVLDLKLDYHTWKILEWKNWWWVWRIECRLPVFTCQLLLFRIGCSYTCSSFNIVPSNWFRLAHLPTLYPSKIFTRMVQAEKYSRVFQWNTWNVLNKDAKKTGHFVSN